MKRYVIKDHSSGKYVTSRPRTRVVFGATPFLFTADTVYDERCRAQDESDKAYLYASKELKRAETEVKKAKRKLDRAEKVAAEATTRELVRMAEDAVKSMRASVKYATKRQTSARRDFNTREKSALSQNLVVHEIKIP